MKRFTVATSVALACLLLAQPAVGSALQPQAKAPHFKARASLAGETFSFSMQKALSHGPVVLYFFPAAFTRGCDVEAHTFAANKAQFEAADTTIIGMSADSIERLNAFSSDPDYCAGEFPVASDPGGKIAAHYGLELIPPRDDVAGVRGIKIDHGFIPRTTFVIDGNGRIVATFSSSADDLTPRQHVTKSLAIVQKLGKNQSKAD